MDAITAIRSAPAGLASIRPERMTPTVAEGVGIAELPPGGLSAQPTGSTERGSFADVLGRFVSEVNGKQTEAGAAVRGLQAGDNVSLHQAVIALEEASVSFQLMVEVRNRLLESYQELMRMQV